MVWGVVGRGGRPWVTSKVAKKIALSILRNYWRFTCLEGNVTVVVGHIMDYGLGLEEERLKIPRYWC